MILLVVAFGCAARVEPTPPPAPMTFATPATPEEEAAAADLMAEATPLAAAGDYVAAREKLRQIVEKYPSARPARAAVRMVAELDLIGTEATPFRVRSWYQGRARVQKKGATLVYFFETWCPHCKNVAPRLAELSTTYAGRMEVVGFTKVNRTASDDTVRAMIEDYGWEFPVGKERDGSMTKAYVVSGIPAAALVRDGVIVWRGHPAKLDEVTLERLLR